MSGTETETGDFELEGAEGGVLRGTTDGSLDGSPIVLVHALTGHRDLVVHGSKALGRAGHRLVRYDARGHGESDATPEAGYGYESLAADLAAVIGDQAAGAAVLAGSSMGAHTVVTLALDQPDLVAGMVLIGPASTGSPPTEESLANWDELADGLADGGVDGFLSAYERQGLDPDWRETLLRIGRERLERHRHPEAVAQAMREVSRSIPFDGLAELETLAVPTLVVASNDKADPGHPFAVAEAYASSFPEARMVSEGEGESPLAWQGGKLSREIASFAESDAVSGRLES